MKNLFLLFFFLLSQYVNAQLGGFGFTPQFGISGEGKRFTGSETRDAYNYGMGIYKEGYGFLFNTQIGINYLHQDYLYSDTAGQTFSFKRDYLQVVPSFKYWFGNAMRAGNIFGMKCAHKTKIIYNYTFKPYFIFGLPYNFLLNSKTISDQTNLSFRKRGLSFFGGIGANIIEAGGNHDPAMIFIEFRMMQELKEFISSSSDKFGFAFQIVLGLKFERDYP